MIGSSMANEDGGGHEVTLALTPVQLVALVAVALVLLRRRKRRKAAA